MQLKKIDFEKITKKINRGLELLIKIDEHEAKLKGDAFERMNMKQIHISLPILEKLALLHFDENCEKWYCDKNRNEMRKAFRKYMRVLTDSIDLRTISAVQLSKSLDKRANSYIKRVMSHYTTHKELEELDWVY